MVNVIDRIKSLFKSSKIRLEDEYEFLGDGVISSSSTFFMARKRDTGEVVGIKLLEPKKAAEYEARFKGTGKPSQGEIACSIDHPRVVKGLRHGVTTDGQPFIVTEYLEGSLLSVLISSRDAKLEGNRLNLIRQMAEAVEGMHSAGYVHRDVNPRNFLCGPDATTLKLIDIGRSVPMDPDVLHKGRLGARAYLAPELVRRKPSDHRVDIFALGVTAYNLCTFKLPWSSGLEHDTHPPQDIRELAPNLNSKLAGAIMKCIAVNPADRFASAEQLLRLLKPLKADYEEHSSSR